MMHFSLPNPNEKLPFTEELTLSRVASGSLEWLLRSTLCHAAVILRA